MDECNHRTEIDMEMYRKCIVNHKNTNLKGFCVHYRYLKKKHLTF